MIDLEESPILVKGPTVRVYALLRYNSGYEQVANGILQIAVDNMQDRSQSYIEVKNDKDQVVFRSRIQRKNNYQIQQQTILCWEDDAHTYNNLALSFMTRQQCDSYWRTICSIIGKNYLEIYGKQELLISTQQNLGSVMNQIKNCYGLVAYNIINDDDNKFMSALSNVFEQMKTKEDEMGIGMIIRIVKSIVGANQIKVIQALLSDKNFNFILQVYSAHLSTKINLKLFYEAKIFVKNFIPLPQSIKDKIITVHRANFFKENILTDLVVEGRLESILDTIAKENGGQIIHYMTSQQFWQSLLTYTRDEYQRFIQNDNEQALQNFAIHSQVSTSEFESLKLQFMIEILAKLTFSGGEKLKKQFIKIVYNTKTFEFISQMIEKNYLQSIEALTEIARLNPLKFLEELREGFRNSTASNLQRTLAKKYVNDLQFSDKIVDLLRVIIYTLIQRKDLLDFFAGTFIIFVIEYSQNALRIVQVLNIILEDLQPPFTLVIYKIIIKHKIFEKICKLLQPLIDNPFKIGQRVRINRNISKQAIILLSKIIRIIINENSEDISKQKAKEKRQKQKENQYEKRSVFFLRSEFYPNVSDARPHHQLPKYTQEQIQQIENMKKYTIKSGIVSLCVSVLRQSIQQNSMLSSSILEIFKTIENKRYNSFTEYVQANLSDDPTISTFFKHIFQIKKVDTRKTDTDSYQDRIRKQNIELQERQDQEKYLLNNEDDINFNSISPEEPTENHEPILTSEQRKKQQMEQLAALREQIKSRAINDLEQEFPKRKKLKKNEDLENEDETPLFLSIDIPQVQ